MKYVILFLLCINLSFADDTVYKCSVFTDMDGFTSSMKVAPKETINRVLAIRKVLVSSLGNGRIDAFIGDSAFVLFDTRDDAIAFVKRSAKDLPEKINFGIACGDVYLIGNDTFGYSANLASKLGEDTAKNGQVLTDLGEITEEIYNGK